MRIVLLTLIILGLIYFIPSSQKNNVQIDAVKMAMGAPVRLKSEIKKINPKLPPEIITKEDSEDALDEQNDQEGEEVSRHLAADEQIEKIEDSNEGDYEKAWQNELSQMLLNLEPVYAEEILDAYVSERTDHQTNLDELVRNNQQNHDLEYLIEDLEIKHEEKIKEILGRNYEEIKQAHLKFLETEGP
jgi:hypothetical protein